MLMVFGLALAVTGMAKAFGTSYLESILWMFILSASSIPYVSATVGAWIAHKSGDAAG
jgi:hypothetical protein